MHSFPGRGSSRRMAGNGAGAVAGLAAVALVVVAAAASPSAQAASAVLPGDLSVHVGNIADTPADYSTQLNDAVQTALQEQQSDGSFEVTGKVKDVGDNSLGVSSLVALYSVQTGDTSVASAFQNSVDWYLNNRVYTTDNPGDTTILEPNSGQPWAAYEPSDIAAGGGGDWPTTVWALNHVVDTLRDGDGLLRPDQQSALITLGQGYWTWLTQVSKFDPQNADNQAIACVDGGLGLAQQMTRLGQASAGAALNTAALNVFNTQVRPLRQTDRGFTFYPEHGAGFDQNYGAIAISFLYQGWKLSGDQDFYTDGLAMTQYLDMRLSARGFDYGGPRHNEDHAGFEAVYGLTHYSAAVNDDLGRYLGTSSIPYYHTSTGTDGVVTPDGHFAFMTVWQMTDPAGWVTASQASNTAYKLRYGNGSLVLDANELPYLVTAGNADVIHAATAGKQGIGLAYTDSAGTHLMPPASGTTPTTSTFTVSGGEGRTVTQTLVGPGGTQVPVTATYTVTDGTVRIRTSYQASLLAGAKVSYVTGLPYLTDAAGGTAPNSPQQKILSVTGLGGTPLSFGTDGGTLTDPNGLTAGPLKITSPTGITVTNPGSAATNDFSSSATLGMTLEQYSTSLNSDPDTGWAKTQQTNLIQAPASLANGVGSTDVTFGS